MKKRQRIRKAIIIVTFLLFPILIFYFSPYLVILGAMEGIVTASLIIFTVQFLLSLILGRSQCGYFCPAGGLQECLMLVNNKKAKGGGTNLIKYCLWVPWVATITFFFIRSGGFKGIDFFYQTTNGVSLNEPFTYVIYYGVILIIVVLALIAGKRALCHYVCWMAPFMVLGTKAADLLKIPRLHLESNKDNCIGCKKCTEKCPMSLEVHKMVKDEKMNSTECILCGECVDICPKNIITYSMKQLR
ncbi:MAG: 4Fe-4S binding protein [Synergistaceae bacterium]|nr:4Fe-4S binding protein [Synergistaceae bacterium]